jgi:hypothetical protein
MRHVLSAFSAVSAFALPSPLAGQAQQPPAYPQTSTAQPASSIPATEATARSKPQVSDANSNAADSKRKICEATVIRAGPNQGQVINKCRRSDK